MADAWSKEWAPAPELQSSVPRISTYDLRGFTPGVHAGLPSRYLTVILSFHDPVDVSGPGPARMSAQAIVGGLHARPAFVHHEGTQVGIQLGIHPLAARELLGVPASEIASIVAPLDHLLPGVAEMYERTWDRPVADRVAALDRLLTPTGRRVAPELRAAWQTLERTGGDVAIEAVADEVGWSRRHLTERFTREFGLRPKEVCRVMRFERAKAMISTRCRPPLARLAVDCGYSDQSHMTREWVRLAGSSPTRWIESEEFPFVQDESGPTMGEWTPN
jgi:AraC-like DNA-binding protein